MRVRVPDGESKLGWKHLKSGFDCKDLDILVNRGILENGVRHGMVPLRTSRLAFPEV